MPKRKDAPALRESEQAGPIERGRFDQQLHPAGNAGAQDALRAALQETSGSGQSAALDFSSLAATASPGQLPFQEELTEFYGGVDLSGIHIATGVRGMESLGANAATYGNTVLFSEDNPAKEVAAEEVGHVLQTGGTAVGNSTTDPTDAAELEAGAAGAAFARGAVAPSLSAKPVGVARDPLPEVEPTGEEQSGLDNLRLLLGASGFVAGLMISAYLRALTDAELRELKADSALLGAVGSAVSASAYLQLLLRVGLPLDACLTELRTAGTLTELDGLALTGRVALLEASEQFAIVNSTAIYDIIAPLMLDMPHTIWASLVNSPLLGAALVANVSFAMDLAIADLERGVELIAGPNVTDSELSAIIPTLGAYWMIAALLLPRGEAQSDAMKGALRRYAAQGPLEMAKQCFRLRFDVLVTGRFEDASGQETTQAAAGAVSVDWTKATILQVWEQLGVLPASDVSENSVLEMFQAISGTGGFWSNSDTIKIGQAASPAKMGHTVRHEIGHAVHTRRRSAINAWLFGDIGFTPMSKAEAGIVELISELGGYPAQYEDAAGNMHAFTDAHRARVKALLVAHGNSGKWVSKTTLPADRTALDGELYLSMPAALQLCFAQSSPKWYRNYTSHAQGPKGSYFYNHWYNQPFWFSARARSVIAATGENYTAMSHKEFFANCYAEYFEDPAGFADHTLWGGALPTDVKDFFSSYIVDKQPYTVVERVGAMFGVEVPGETARESNT